MEFPLKTFTGLSIHVLYKGVKLCNSSSSSRVGCNVFVQEVLVIIQPININIHMKFLGKYS